MAQVLGGSAVGPQPSRLSGLADGELRALGSFSVTPEFKKEIEAEIKSRRAADGGGAATSRLDVGRAVGSDSGAVVLQPRDRDTIANVIQTNEIASNPDYQRAGVSRSMDQGAPVVFGDVPDGAVLGREEMVVDGLGRRIKTQYAVIDASKLITSNTVNGAKVPEYENGVPGKLRAVAGNGRGAGLIAAWDRGTATNYRQELLGDSEYIGINRAEAENIKRPVLVRLMNEADITADIGDRSNISAGARMSPVEQAAVDIRRFNLLDADFDDRGMPSMPSLQSFVLDMPTTERGELQNPDGSPTKLAAQRMQAAAFKQAYGDDGLLQLHAQALDQDATNVMTALAKVAGGMSQLEGGGEFDIRQAVVDAARIAVNAARDKEPLASYLKRNGQDMYMNSEATVIAEFMAENIRSASRIAEGLRRIVDLALEQVRILRENESQAGMFGDRPTMSRQEIFERLRNAREGENEQRSGLEPATQNPTRRPNQSAGEGAGKTDGSGRYGQGVEPASASEGASGQVGRPNDWRSNYLRAAAVARQLGIKPQDHKELGNLVAAIDAHDARAEVTRQGDDGNVALFSRSASTKATYEARIDALFSGEKAAGPNSGATVLDRSDVLAMLGFGAGPVRLAEGKVLKGQSNHPRMTAAQWKKVPQWLDNPAAVFDSDTVPGRLTMIAPELINGNMVLLAIEPNADGASVHVLVNAFDKDGGPPPVGRWLRDGLGRMVDQKKFPAVLGDSGLQLSSSTWQNKPGMRKILTEKHLAGYRRANDSQQSFAGDEIPAKSGATVSTIAAAIRKAYGNVLDKLQAKGLVTLVQSQAEALEAAAKARAEKTGEPLAQVREQLLASVRNSISVWHGTPHRGIEQTGFTLNKIGTGEGAQAYGWGMYFASTRAVAEAYRKSLSKGDRHVFNTDFLKSIREKEKSVNSLQTAILQAQRVVENKGTWAKYGANGLMAAQSLHEKAGYEFVPYSNAKINRAKKTLDASKTQLEQAEKDLAKLQRQRELEANGQLYGLDLPVEEFDLLDWDKPLSEQSPKVRAALQRNDRRAKDSFYGSGKEYYHGLVGRFAQDAPVYFTQQRAEDEFGAKAASEYLQSIGIPGLRYLDGNSRSSGEGSHNYVIWDEALMTPEAANIEAKFSQDGAIQGFYDPQSGQSFLVADGMTNEAAPGVLAHEVGIHMATDTQDARGKAAMVKLVNRAGMILKLDKSDFMKGVRQRMRDAGETSNEEAAAYIAEAYENERANAPASVKRWVQDFIAAVRGWLFQHGVIVRDDMLTPADIAAIARANVYHAARGGQTRVGDGAVRQSQASPTDAKVRDLVAQYASTEGAPTEAKIRKAVQDYRDTERAYGGRDAYQKAKDAGKTKLNYRQWVIVRTPNFKRWFGDWENDPANASKVVDSETGEPLVVYHGTNADFSKFDKEYQRTGQYGGEGFFFTANPETSGLFGDAIMPVFLRAKTGILEKRRARTEGREVSVDHIRPQNDQRDIWVVFNPTQIKSATGNIGTFGNASGDIRFSRRPSTQAAQNTADSRASTAAQNPSNPSQVWAAIEGMFEGVGGLRQRLDAGTTVVRSADELPQQFQQAAKDAQAQGFYDDKSKRIYLVADRIEAGRLPCSSVGALALS